MIIPKIWKNKKCSKPPTSQNLPANACRAMAYCCLLQVFFKAVRSSSVPHKKLFCALQRKLNETQAQNAVERFQHSCFVSPNTATRPHFLKKNPGPPHQTCHPLWRGAPSPQTSWTTCKVSSAVSCRFHQSPETSSACQNINWKQTAIYSDPVTICHS